MKLRESIRKRTPRNSGVSLKVTIDRINPTLRGWFVYFKHASGGLHTMDGWIRERLRNILRHQHKLPGRSGKMDHKRWPNRFFATMGLYSLDQAHKVARQSMKMVH
jgi:RNA-directed DNA polymerase